MSFPRKGNRGEAFSILQNDSKEKRNGPGMATCLTTVVFGQKLHKQLNVWFTFLVLFFLLKQFTSYTLRMFTYFSGAGTNPGAPALIFGGSNTAIHLQPAEVVLLLLLFLVSRLGRNGEYREFLTSSMSVVPMETVTYYKSFSFFPPKDLHLCFKALRCIFCLSQLIKPSGQNYCATVILLGMSQWDSEGNWSGKREQARMGARLCASFHWTALCSVFVSDPSDSHTQNLAQESPWGKKNLSLNDW